MTVNIHGADVKDATTNSSASSRGGGGGSGGGGAGSAYQLGGGGGSGGTKYVWNDRWSAVFFCNSVASKLHDPAFAEHLEELQTAGYNVPPPGRCGYGHAAQSTLVAAVMFSLCSLSLHLQLQPCPSSVGLHVWSWAHPVTHPSRFIEMVCYHVTGSCTYVDVAVHSAGHFNSAAGGGDKNRKSVRREMGTPSQMLAKAKAGVIAGGGDPCGVAPLAKAKGPRQTVFKFKSSPVLGKHPGKQPSTASPVNTPTPLFASSASIDATLSSAASAAIAAAAGSTINAATAYASSEAPLASQTTSSLAKRKAQSTPALPFPMSRASTSTHTASNAGSPSHSLALSSATSRCNTKKAKKPKISKQSSLANFFPTAVGRGQLLETKKKGAASFID